MTGVVGVAEADALGRTGPTSPIERVLAITERRIALIARCHPLNYAEEYSRLVRDWSAGHREAPQWRYPSIPDVGDTEVVLEQVLAHLLGAHHDTQLPRVWRSLYAERVAELLLEARLVRLIGQPSFGVNAATRFTAGDAPSARRARQWAEAWVKEPRPASEPRVPSDDEREPRSLVAVLRARIGTRRLPVRVEVDAQLASTAAASDRAVFVRPSVWLRERDVERIVAHEVEAHVVPRLAARRTAMRLIAIGTAQAEDEEGRAIAIEQRTRGFDAERRQELGLRHLAALAVRSGATFVETVEHLLALGASVERAITIAARCHRGGGVAREIVYLPALARYQAAMAAGVPVERWMRSGRVGVLAAVRLHEAGVVLTGAPATEAA